MKELLEKDPPRVAIVSGRRTGEIMPLPRLHRPRKIRGGHDWQWLMFVRQWLTGRIQA